MAMVPKSRLLDLKKLQCAIYGHSFNPLCIRTGNKILRQRLKGPAVAAYYPPRSAKITDFKWMFRQFDTWDDDEEDRFEKLAITQARGKGAPKKKRTKEESKKFGKKKQMRRDAHYLVAQASNHCT